MIYIYIHIHTYIYIRIYVCYSGEIWNSALFCWVFSASMLISARPGASWREARWWTFCWWLELGIAGFAHFVVVFCSRCFLGRIIENSIRWWLFRCFLIGGVFLFLSMLSHICMMKPSDEQILQAGRLALGIPWQGELNSADWSGCWWGVVFYWPLNYRYATIKANRNGSWISSIIGVRWFLHVLTINILSFGVCVFVCV